MAVFNADSAGGDKTITLTASATVGTLFIMGKPATLTNYTFSSNTLTFDNSGGIALWQIQDNHNVTFNTAVNLASDLSIIIPNDGSGNASSLLLNGAVSGNGNNLSVGIDWANSTVTFGSVISGTGTQLTKTGVGTLNLNNVNNTFTGGFFGSGGLTAINVNGVSGTLVIGASQAGANNLGVGNVSLDASSDPATAIRILTTNTNQSVVLAGSTLTLANGSLFSFIRNNASTVYAGSFFAITGGTLDGGAGATPATSGTLYLSGVDFSITGGSIINSPNLWFDSGLGATVTSVQLISGAGATAITGLGNITRTGTLGILRIDSSVASLSANNFSVASGTLDLGTATITLAGSQGLVLGMSALAASNTTTNVLLNKSAQFTVPPAITVVPGLRDALSNTFFNIATLSLNNTDQSLGPITTGSLGYIRLDMGPSYVSPGAAVNTLTLTGPATFADSANPNSYINIINWDGDPAGLANGTAPRQDILAVSPASGITGSQLWFYGFERGAVSIGTTPTGDTIYAPTTFMTGTAVSTVSAVSSLDYFDYRNWMGNNPAGMTIPNHAGATADFTLVSPYIGSSSAPRYNLGNSGTITLGRLLLGDIPNTGITSGASAAVGNTAIIWDSGVQGVSAVIRTGAGSNYGYGNRATWVLNSNLDVYASSAYDSLIGNITGSGTVSLMTGRFNYNQYASSLVTDFGGFVINPGALLNLSRSSDEGTTYMYDVEFTGLGSSTPIFINGGEIDSTRDGSGITFMLILPNLLVFAPSATLASRGITYAYDGNIVLSGTNGITTNGNLTLGYASDLTTPVIFSASTNLTGAGGLAKAGSQNMRLLSPNNDFSGGLYVTGGTVSTKVGAAGINIGSPDPGRNYLGSGLIYGNNTNIFVLIDNQGLAASDEITGTVNMTNSSRLRVTNGGTLTLQSTGVIDGGTAGSAGGVATSRGGLSIGDGVAFVNNSGTLLNSPIILFSNVVDNTLSGDPLTGVGTLRKEGPGNTFIDTTVQSFSLNVVGGNFVLNTSGNNMGTAYFFGGALNTGSNTANTFGQLYLAGNAGIFMAGNSTLTFSYFSPTTANYWTPSQQLNIANETGIWNTAETAALGTPVADTYVYVTNTTTNANQGQLGLIAFTGYTPGAEYVAAGPGLWFIAPKGTLISEWSGNPSAGYTGVNWSNPDDWFGARVPNSAGAYAAFRDLDQLLSGKTVLVDVSSTIGALELSSASVDYTIASAPGQTLTFDSGDPSANATLRIANAGTPIIAADLVLTSTLDFANNNAVASLSTLSSYITGPGAINYTVVNTGNTMRLSGNVFNSDYTGGFTFLGSAATTYAAAARPTLLIEGDGSPFGPGSYNGTDAENSTQSLTIGNGSGAFWYGLLPSAIPDGNGTRTIDASLRLAGNLFFGATTGYSGTMATLVIKSDDPSYITAGTWALNGNSMNNANAIITNRLVLQTDLEGPGTLKINSYTRVMFSGTNNTAWTGGLNVDSASSFLLIGADNAPGTGTVWLNGNGSIFIGANNNPSLYGTDGMGAYSIGNEIVFNNNPATPGTATLYFTGTLTLNHTGTSTLLAPVTHLGAYYSSIASTGNLGFGENMLIFAASNTLVGDGILRLGAASAAYGGIIRFEGANTYTGNTEFYYGSPSSVVQVADDRALGSGTLVFNSYASSVMRLSSYGRDVTLSNPVNFTALSANGQPNAGYVLLRGDGGMLTLDAPAGADINPNQIFNVDSGTAAFGANLSFSNNIASGDASNLTKAGSGALIFNSGYSTYTGATLVNNGVLRVNASGDITTGYSDLGNNYLGIGNIGFDTSVSSVMRYLELVAPDGGNVNLGSTLISLNGQNAAYSSTLAITTTPGEVSGDVTTNLGGPADQVIVGNAFGYLRAPGDIVKTTANNLTFASGNIVANGSFIARQGGILFQGGALTTPNLDIQSGAAVTMQTITYPAVQQLTLETGATLNILASATATLANAALNIAGDSILNLNGGGILTLGSAPDPLAGTLTVENWNGLITGGGATRIQFATSSISSAFLNSITFENVNPSIVYDPGARAIRNSLGFYELIPLFPGVTWTGLAGNYLWDGVSDTNWEPQNVPNGQGKIATFADEDPNLDEKTITLTTNVTLGELRLRSSADHYTLSGNPFFLYFNQTPGMGNAYLTLDDANSVTIDAQVGLYSNLDVTTQGTGTLFFNKPISSFGITGLNKYGESVMVLNAANNFNGGFTLYAGKVIMGDDHALSTGPLNLDGGELDAGGVARTLTNGYTLGGTTAYTGTLTLAGLGSLTDDGGGIITNGLLILSNTLSNSLSGTGGLTKSGTGMLVLSSTNTFIGGLTLQDGVTQIPLAAALGTGTVSFAGNATLQTTAPLTITNAIALLSDTGTLSGTETVSGVISGEAALAVDGMATLTAANTLTGTLIASDGTISVGAGGAAGSIASANVSLATPASELRFDNSVDTTYAGEITGAGNFVKMNTNTLTLTGSSAISGTTVVNAGILQVGDGNDYGYISIINGGTDIVAVNAANAAIAFNRSDAITLTGTITGIGQLVQNGGGLLDILSTNKYTGGTVINSGTVRVRATSYAGNYGDYSTVNVTGAGEFVIGAGSWDTSAYFLDYRLAGEPGGIVAVDIGSPYTFYFGNNVATALANGAAFQGELDMRRAKYEVSAAFQAFFAGGGNLRTEDGSFGSVAAPNISMPEVTGTWTMPGGVTFAGGTMAWEFNSANQTNLISAAGPIAIADTATTTFQLTLQNTINAPTLAEIQAHPEWSLFKQDTGGDTLTLAHSDDSVSGAYDHAKLQIYVPGLGLQQNTSVSQLTAQDGSTVAKATYDWAAYGAAGDPLNINSTDLTVGYKLMKLEVFKDQSLEIIRGANDPAAFDVLVTDMASGTGSDPVSGTAANGMGSVRFMDASAAQTGILLGLENTYTGTSFIESGTVIAGLNNPHALGATANLMVGGTASMPSAAGAFDLNGQAQTVGALNTGEGAVVNIHGGTLTISDAQRAVAGDMAGGHIANNTVYGNGLLIIDPGVVLVDGTQAFSGAYTIEGSSTVVLNTAGALQSADQVKLDSATDMVLYASHTDFLAIDPTGTCVDLISGSDAATYAGIGGIAVSDGIAVTLTGSNTEFSGTWYAWENSTLKATGANSLGAAQVVDSGTFILGGTTSVSSANWTLAPANTISGAGALVKEDANQVTIAQANPDFTGNTYVNTGTLRLAAQGAVGPTGAATIAANADLLLDYTGTWYNYTAGSGTAEVAATRAVDITGNNSTFAGAWKIDPAASATMTTQQNLGATGATGATVAIDAGGALYLENMGGDFTLDNVLNGAGLLDINLAAPGNVFALDSGLRTQDAAFSGTVNFHNATYTLTGGDFAGATLVSSANSAVTIGSGSNPLASYVFNGGLTNFDLATNPANPVGADYANGWINASGAIVITSGTVLVTNPQVAATNTYALLLQDNYGGGATILAKGASVSGDVSDLTLLPASSLTDTSTAAIMQTNETGGAVAGNSGEVATGYYLRGALARTDTTVQLTGGPLVQLDLLSGKTTVLDNAVTHIIAPGAGDNMTAQIDGSGTLWIYDAALTGITLTGTNTNTGGIVINEGALIAGNVTNAAWALGSATNTIIYNNTTDGSQLRFLANATMTQRQVITDNAAATLNAGAGNTLTVTATTYAGDGAAVSIATGATFDLLGGSIFFTSNTATANGGAIAAAGDAILTARFTDTLAFTGNTAGATGNGGALNAGGAVSIDSGADALAFTGNTAGANGGAINAVGDVTLTNVLGGALDITGNTAGGKGGAIYSGGDFTLTLADANSTFTATNNKAANDASGGFLYANSGSMLFNIAAGAQATLGDATSIATAADSIAAADSTISLTKSGAGVLTLNARNTYTGTTFVNAGYLEVNGYQSSTFTNVAANATYAGTGTNAGDLTIRNGGTLSPGLLTPDSLLLTPPTSAAGWLTIGAPEGSTNAATLTFDNGAQLLWQLTDTTGAANATGAFGSPAHVESTNNDLVIVNGNVNLSEGAGTSTLNLNFGASSVAIGQYDLIYYTGALTGSAGNMAFGAINVGGAAETDFSLYRIVTAEPNWIKLTYGIVNFAIWDSGSPGLWNDGTVSGGNGIWQAPGVAPVGTNIPWTDDSGAVNGEWEQGSMAIFGGVTTSGTVTVQNDGEQILIGGLQFARDGYYLSGGTLTTTATSADNNIPVTLGSGGAFTSATISSEITGATGLDIRAISDAGLLTLEGASTYTGTTLVGADASAVALVVNGRITGSGVYVGANSLLAGTGIIDAPVEMSPGSVLSPGSLAESGVRSPESGKLTITNSLALAANTTLAMQLTAPTVWDSAQNSWLDVTGNLDIAPSATLAVSTTTAGLGAGLYHLVSYTGSLTYSPFNTLYDASTGLSAANSYVQTAKPHEINLVTTGTNPDENKNPASLLAFTWWDGSGSPATMNDGNIAGGDGTWFAWSVSNGTAATPENWAQQSGAANAMWQPAGYAHFAGASGVVTLDNSAGQVTASALDFLTDGYLLQGGQLTLAGASLATPSILSAAADVTATLAMPITAAGDVTKTGEGAIVLAAENTYTGTLTLAEGALVVNTLLTTPSVTTALNTTLAGSGTLAGAVTVSGTLAPGSLLLTPSSGTLTLTSNLNLTANAVSAFDLGANGNDLVNVSTALVLGGTLNVAQNGAFDTGVYRLYNYAAGQLTDNTLAIGAIPTAVNNQNYFIQTSVAGQVNLVYIDDAQRGAVNYWDGGMTTANDNTITGGNGVWQAWASNSDNWTTADGSLNAPWQDYAHAMFTAAGGTVTLDKTNGDLTASGMTFNVGGYLLQSGSLILGGGEDTATLAVSSTTGASISATIATILTGTVGIEKTGPDTLVLTAANTFGGTTSVSSGTLILTNLAATSDGDVTVAGSAELLLRSVAGAYANNITGGGTTSVSSDATVNLTGANTIAAWNIAGSATVTGAQNLGPGSTRIDGQLDIVSAAAWNYVNALTGSGLLNVNTSGADFSFAPSSVLWPLSSGFTGTVELAASTFALGADNTAALTAATLQLDAGNRTTVADGTQTIGNLTLNGGRIDFDATVPADIASPAFVATATLALDSGTVAINRPAAAGADQQTPLLQQDEGALTQLASADTVTGAATNLSLIDAVTGGALGANTQANINQGGATVASGTYDLALATSRPGSANDGLYVSYRLTALDLLAGQTTTLASDTTTPAGGDDMTAKITGAGNLAIDAARSITLANASNAYTGTTFVNTGTLVSGANNALGATSFLDVAAAAAFDLGSHTQTVGAIDTAATSLLNIATGSLAVTNGGQISGALAGESAATLTLGGTTSVSSTNANFASSVNVTGTTTMSDVASLGDTGAATIAANALLTTPATGTLAKTLAGAGDFALTANANVTLSATNANFSGTFTTAANTALIATTTANLGTALIADTGTFIMRNAAAETLGNALSGAGAFVKENTGNLTIATPNATFTGTTLVSAGTLTLADLGGVGLGDITDNSVLVLADTGVFANNISGGGTTSVSSGAFVNLTGANTIAAWDIAGSGTVTGTQNLGAGNVQIDRAGTLTLAPDTGGWLFTNTLAGQGDLYVRTASGTFDYASATGSAGVPPASAFTGTTTLLNTTITLGSANENAANLANSTLQLLASSTLFTASETRPIGGLDMGAGSVTSLPMNGLVPRQVLQTGTLSVDTLARVAFEGYTGAIVDSTTMPKNFLDQDGPTPNATLLIATGSLLSANRQITVTQQDGVTPLDGGQQVDYGNVIATYGYTGITVTASTAASVIGSDTAGLYYDYVLTVLDIKSGTTLAISNSDATDTTLAALVTGTGSLVLGAGATSITVSHSNSYTGTTTITSGTIIADNTDALGHTANLIVASAAAYDLNGNTQSIGSGSIAGALIGAATGSLGLNGLVDITSANPDFAANAGVTGTTVMHNTQALGDSGTASVSSAALLQLTNATGALAKTLAGPGAVELSNNSAVTLTATNANFSGTFLTDAATTLIATTTANLGAALIADSGAFIMRNAADETLGNTLTGAGSFVKDAAGNLTIARDNNAFTGATLISAGTLTLADLGGAGSGDITNNAALDLAPAASGVFANNISGAGTTFVSSGPIAITGSNATTWNITPAGIATVTQQQNLGSGATRVDGVLIINSASAWNYIDPLTGAGRIIADTTASSFDFAPAARVAGAPFTGTLELKSSTFDLSGANDLELAAATLQLDSGNTTTVGSGTQFLAGLALAGGRIDFAATVPADLKSETFISTATLALTSGTVAVNKPTVANTSTIGQLPLLQQDEGNIGAQLAAATTVIGSATLNTAAFTLIDAATGEVLGGPTQAAIIQAGATTAIGTYDYGLTSGTLNDGLYVSYKLTALDLQANQTTTLASDTTTPAQADNMTALITGSGNLAIDATRSITLTNAANTYTGTTFVTSGTLVSGADNALGDTAALIVGASLATPSAFDLATHAQTIGAITTATDTLLNIATGSLAITNGGAIAGALAGESAATLTLGGTTSVSSANANFASSVNVTGTTTLGDVASIGNTGAATIAGNAGILLGGSGALAKTLAGQGTLELNNNANVTLTATNANFSGAFTTDANTALIATTTANLGTARIADSGTFIMRNAADETLGNALSGSGAFVKENTGNLTIATPNATFAGTTLVTAGTLTLANLGGVGQGDITNNAALDLAANGAFANNISGGGTTSVSSGPITLTGTNQTTWNITPAGNATVTSTANLGSGATRIDGELAINSPTAWLYINPLTGNGTLYVNTAGADFAFAPSSVLWPLSSGFTGTLELAASTFALSATNAQVLAQATLQLDPGNTTTVGAGTQQIGALTLAGGRIDFGANVPADIKSETFITTGALTLATGTVAVNKPALNADTPAVGQLPLLQQDEGLIGAQLASATTVAGAANLADPAKFSLIDAATGQALTNATQASINQNGVTVASGTYDYGLTASRPGEADDGLYVSYKLTAMDLLAGQTTVLASDATDPAQADNMQAKITGAGNLAIDATQSITLANANNTYTGTTLVQTGTLISGADNALGQTSALVVGASLATPSAFDLASHAQTVGSITTDANTLLNLNTGALTVQNGGLIAGSLAGANTATLTLAGGTTSVSSANPDFAARTAIAAPATARITNAAALGTSAIALDGTLIADIPGGTTSVSSAPLLNTLAGNGQLQKTNTGALTLAASSPNFQGSATIAQGAITTGKIDALGAAPVAVAANATFEQTHLAGILQNPLSGEGTHLITSGTLVINNAPAYTIANTTLDATSALVLATTGVNLGALNLNGGSLVFDTLNGAANVATLASGGNIFMNANLATLVSNTLTIANSAAPSANVYVNPTGEPAMNTSIPLICLTNGGTTNFILASGKLEYDLTALDLVRGDGSQYTPDTNMWYLSDRALSHVADAIIKTVSTMPLDWSYSMDSLYLRMGETRDENLRSASAPTSDLRPLSSGNLWVKTRAYRLNVSGDADNTGMSYHQYTYGVTAGMDKTFHAQNGVTLLGAFIDAGRIDRTFDDTGSGGTGSTNTIGIGAYLTLLRGNGYFADLVARVDRYSNSFDARAANGTITHGDYSATSQGVSLEAGKRITRQSGWWVEPTLQASLLWMNSASFDTRATAAEKAMHVTIGSSQGAQYRALVRFGKQFKNSRWSPYGKIAGVAVDTQATDITAHGKTVPAANTGKRVEFGAGTTYRINAGSQFYFDYEYDKAPQYERPWSLNLGYRKVW